MNATSSNDPTFDQGLQTCMHVIGALSAFACIAVFLAIKFHPRLRTGMNTMIFWLACCDFSLALAHMFGTMALNSNDPSASNLGCTLQGICIQFMFTASVAWNFLIPLHCYLIIASDHASSSLQHLWKWYHLYAWGLSFFFLAMLFIVQAASPREQSVFGPATLVCWISSSYKEYRIWFFYLYMMVQFAGMIALYIAVFLKVRSMLTSSDKNDQDTPPNVRRGVKKMMMKTFALALGFLVCWMPASISRIMGSLGYSVPYWLFFVQALTMPAHGLSDSLIFLTFAYNQSEDSDSSTVEAKQPVTIGERSKAAVIQMEMKIRSPPIRVDTEYEG